MPNLVNFFIDYKSEMPILILFPNFSRFFADLSYIRFALFRSVNATGFDGKGEGVNEHDSF